MSFPLRLSYFSQGVDTTETRQVSTKVPLAQVPYIMRALGFYPTEQEVCYFNLVIARLSKVAYLPASQHQNIVIFLECDCQHVLKINGFISSLSWNFKRLIRQLNISKGVEVFPTM